MLNESPFLKPEDFNRFREPGRFCSRYVVKRPVDENDGDPPLVELATLAAETMRAISQSRTSCCRCHCVTVRTDDGMSWSAEAVRQRIAADFPHFSVLGLGDREDQDISYVSQLVGERGFFRAAAKRKLTKWYPGLYASRTFLGIALLGIVGVVVEVGKAVLKAAPAGTAAAAMIRDPTLVITSIALALLGVLSKVLVDQFAPGQKERSIKLLKQNLSECEALASKNQAPRHYTAFVDDLTAGLQRLDKPRVVIIDNYERLDPTTRAVIEQYFRVSQSNARGSEYWMILELPNGQTFSSVVQNQPGCYEQDKFEFLKQLPLSPKAIHDLAQTLALKEIPPGSVVKWVCAGRIPQGDNRVLNFLQKHREDHPANPEQYGNLEFFFLLSMASTPTEITFKRCDLLSHLIERNLRAEVLKVLLSNTKLGTDLAHNEFDRNLSNIQQEFSPFLETSARGELRFYYEPAKTLESRAASFGLPDPALAHLYWGLYWYDKCQNRAPQAFLVRKLCYHLLAADVSKLPGPLLPSVVHQVFEALLVAIDLCIKTCLFSELPALVSRAANYYGITRPEQRGRTPDRLLRRCWDCFSIHGDERILATILELQQDFVPSAAPRSQDNSSWQLTELFLAVIPVDEHARAAVRGAFRDWGERRQYENVQAARRNADATAGWLVTVLFPLLATTGTRSTFLEQASLATDILPAHFRTTYANLERQKADAPMLTDVMTLSLCLWSVALRLEFEYSPDLVQLLTDMAHEALIVATELSERTSGPNMEAVMNALSRELAAVALASLIVAFTFSHMALDDATTTNMQNLLADGLELLGQPAGADLSSTALLKDVDALLSLSAMIWLRFGLERLRDFAYLRRLQFNFICRHIPPDNHVRMQPLLEAVSPALANQGATGILANCVVASSVRSANDLSSRYLKRAAELARKGEFAPELKTNLALLIICAAHNLRLEVDDLAGILVAGDESGALPLRKFFEGMSPSLIEHYALKLLNVSGRVHSDSLAAALENVVFGAAGFIQDPEQRANLESLIQLHRLRNHAKRGEPLPPEGELLAAWSSEKHSWKFASVLGIIVNRIRPCPESWKQAYALMDRDPSRDTANSYYTLAMDLAEHSHETKPTRQQRAALIHYLRYSVARWEGTDSVESNLQAYKLLSEIDEPNRPIYEGQYVKWHKIKIERDHLESLPALVSQKKYFLLFNEYYDSARFWGMRSDGSAEQWHAFRREDTNERKRAVAAWLGEGGRIPEPMAGEHRSVVCSRFIWIGFRLFSPPFYKDEKYDDDRKRFDRAAKGAVADLVAAILRLPTMPEEVRALLAYHSKQLLSYAAVSDTGGGIPNNAHRVAVGPN